MAIDECKHGHAINKTIHVLAVVLLSVLHAYYNLIIANVKIRKNVVWDKKVIIIIMS